MKSPLREFTSKLRTYVWWLRTRRRATRLTADGDSFRTFRRLSNPLARTVGREAQALRVQPLGGATIFLRPGTTDAGVAWAALVGRSHLPPDKMENPHLDEPSLIWDLGANVGLTMAQMAHQYPRARIVGVELDPSNAAQARKNVAAWADRCSVIEAAVWPSDGRVQFAGQEGHEDGIRVAEDGSGTAEAISLTTLRERVGPPAYVKMDIEGAEQAVLSSDTGWALSVKSIAVECHPPYSLKQCVHDLTTLGFEVRTVEQSLRRRSRDLAVGVRP